MAVSSFRRILSAEVRFAALMMLASALGFMKALMLTAVLEAQDFGFYITSLGVATILSILSSLGAVETSITLYPKLYLTGDYKLILHHALRTARLLTLRIMGLTTLMVVVLIATSRETLLGFGVLDIVSIAIMASVIASQLLVASIIRAVGNMGWLQLFTMARGASPLMIAVPLATIFGWRVVFAAETAMMGFVLVLSLLWLLRHEPQSSSLSADSVKAHTHSGRLLYAANLIAASIPYGGRSAVLAFSGPVMAGGFGLVTLLVQIGQMLAGALSQKVGPQMIRDATLNQFNPRVLLAPMVLMAMLTVGAAVIFSLSFLVPFGREYWQGYGITPGILGLVTLNIALPIYLFFQFALISQQQETVVLQSAIAATVICYSGFIMTAQMEAGLIGYVLSILAADAFQTIFMAVTFFRKLSHARLHPPHQKP